MRLFTQFPVQRIVEFSDLVNSRIFYAAIRNAHNTQGGNMKKVLMIIGVDAYLDEFEEWFEDNAGGFCTR